MENFEVNSNQIDKIKKIDTTEKNFRIKNLNFFNKTGFPNKKLEDWKFSDFKNIINKNFDELKIDDAKYNLDSFNLLKEFQHNYIIIVNGKLHSSDFKFEDKDQIIIKPYISNNADHQFSYNPLICLNHALAENGYFLEVKQNYKFKKVLVVYNYFTEDIKNKILNNKNKIKVCQNSEVHLIDYIVNKSQFKFINNAYDDLILEKNAKFKNLFINSKINNGYFYKFSKNSLYLNSSYSNFIFSSGLKFNKLDIECDLLEKNSKCDISSALFLGKSEHQEIKTRINHYAPNCESYQKVKKVLSSDSKGVYQGKIFVKDNAQKTDAYQLSKALLLNDDAEFNSKPELEIYADDVKCSHGSTSGSIDEDSIFYLMTRGLSKNDAKKLLITGFLNEIIENIKSETIKNFIYSKIDEQVNEY